MIESRKEEFIQLYEKYRNERGTIATSDEVFMEMLNLFIISTKVSDKKRTARLILKTKPSMSGNPLWSFIDEDELNRVIKPKAP
ncbi:hypothetical protein B1748_29065 [Paenibacillus sp. MY03]|uniref:hypothetical protein n=1 Tax=Paenibacillus sp. MY03 TaxID=302980 RepID=UPI000B3CCB4E|nr:hypothetical protein [Paenibacillus sp. MY03]OUS70289.1 hypothetical protein B1748_29065 [Paenibacillus sp. MY03]